MMKTIGLHKDAETVLVVGKGSRRAVAYRRASRRFRLLRNRQNLAAVVVFGRLAAQVTGVGPGRIARQRK